MSDTKEQVAKKIEQSADANGMCRVRALTKVQDNGNRYAAGDELHMHRDLLPAHLETGQVELIGKNSGKKSKKTPANKQHTGGSNKGSFGKKT